MPTIDMNELNGSNGFVFHGIGNAGFSVSNLGDVNGDGIDDVIVGSSVSGDPGRFPDWSSGESYVIFGKNVGWQNDQFVNFAESFDYLELQNGNGFMINRPASSVSGVGDFNGDGINDIIIGDNSSLESYVIFGGDSIVEDSSRFYIQDFEGVPIFVGDSIEDSFRFYVEDLNGSNGFIINGFETINNEYPDEFDLSVNRAGDINNDGLDDLIISLDQYNYNFDVERRDSYVVYGRENEASASFDVNTLDGNNGFAIQEAGGFGSSGAGDFNGDGYGDLLLSGESNEFDSETTHQVIFSNTQYSPFPASFNPSDLGSEFGNPVGNIDNLPIIGQSSDWGYSVSKAGDINGDGYDDLIIGDPEWLGTVYVLFGEDGGNLPSDVDLSSPFGYNGFSIQGDEFSNFGESVSGAGDLNGDGFDDLIIGAPLFDNFVGKAYVVLGSDREFDSTLFLSDLDSINIQGISSGGELGYSVSGAGDLNSDGFDDLIVGAPGANESYVIFSSELFDSNPPTVINPIPDRTGTEDVFFSFQIPANTFDDPDNDELRYSVHLTNGDSLPSWLNFDAQTLTLSGTPSSGETLDIEIQVTDGNQGFASTNFNLIVEDVNDAPILRSALSDRARLANSFFSFQIPNNTFKDIDIGDSLTYSATLLGEDSLPTWLNFDPISQTFSGTPTESDIGSLEISVTATDTVGAEVSDTFDLEILPTVWDSSIVLSENLTIPVGDTLTIEPGTIVKFTNPFAGLDVRGTLDIQGTLENPVILTSWLDDSIGGDSNGDGNASSPTARNWSGITFSGAAASGNLENVEIRYADKAIDGIDGATINLSNAVLTENNFGVHVYSPLVEVNAENLLVARNKLTGVFMRADSQGVYRNATIIENGFSGSGWHGAGIHLGGANLTVENSIVAFNNNGLDHTTNADPPITNFNHTLFYNPDGEEIIWNGDPNKPDLTQDGNKIVDPLFSDRAAGDYTLLPSSPAIDAGQGANLPGRDLLGQSRVDDPGIANTGTGSPDYGDMGVYEFQGQSQPTDLAVTGIDNLPSTPLSAGDSFTASYTVTNLGQLSASGGWTDRVYLSSDRFISPDDTLLATREQFGALASGESYTEVLDLTLPATAGPQYLLVSADIERAITEANELNNLGVSSQTLSVDVPLLNLGGTVSGEVQQGEWTYFRFEGESGDPVSIALDAAAPSGTLALYNQLGAVPNAIEYDAVSAVVRSPDQTLRILEPQDGTYYLGVYGQSVDGGSTPVTLSAKLTQPTLYGVAQSEVTNGGLVTLEIAGDNLSADDAIQLVAADGTTLTPVSVVNDDPTRSYATFDLDGVDSGAYDLTVQFSGGQILTLEDEIAVGDVSVNSQILPSPFYADLEVPSAVRPGREVKLALEYGNKADGSAIADMTSPLITIESDLEMEWQLPGTGEWVTGNSMSFLALSSSGTANILRPNQQEALDLKIRPPFSTGHINFTVYAMGASADDGSNEAIDWDNLEADSRLPGMSDEAWAAVWDNVEAQTGSTWGDFVTMLGENAAYLERQGQSVYDTASLFAFEVLQANGLNPNSSLAAARDAFTLAPGLSLSFSRVYGSSLASRYETGALGRGWTHNYDLSLETRDNGDILVHGADGSVRVFASDGNGGYSSSSPEDGVLTANGDGTFALRTRSGMLYNFRTDLQLGSILDPNGNSITASYANGNLTQLTHSAGQTLQFEYDSNGLISRVFDQDGQEALYTYDANSEHLTQVTDFDGQITTYTYDVDSHSLLTVSNEVGNQLTYTYDDLNRLASAGLNGGAEQLTYSYDNAGAVTVTDSAGNAATLYFDHRGIPVKTDDPLGVAHEFGFDGDGNLTQINRPDGFGGTVVYDGNGNPSQITDAADNTIVFKFDETYNNLLWIQDAKGNTTHYDYDGAGNLARITYPDNSAERFQVDATGNLVGYTNRRGDEFTYGNNEDGLLVNQTNPNGSAIDYTYDARGYLKSVTDGQGTTTLDYNTDNRLSKITYPNGRFLSYGYDTAGRHTQMVDQDGVTTNYTYDTVGRLSKLTDGNNNLIVDYTYDGLGRLSREDKGNGTATTYTYDTASQLVNLVHFDADGNINSRYDYTYDEVGQITAMNTLDGMWTYDYDPTGQLISAMFASTNPDIPNQDLTYEYDAAGNRIRTIENGVTTDYSSNDLNQYTTVGTTAYEYDLDGNLIGKTDGNDTWTYNYDAENHLIEVIEPTGNVTQYERDAFGNRTATIYNGNRTEYLIDPFGMGNVVAEFDSVGNRVASFTHGIGLETVTDNNGLTGFYDFNAIGSTVGLTDTIGDYLNPYSYRPFGQEIYEIERINNTFEYVGQWGVAEEINGLNFMRTKLSDSNIGRFTTTDSTRLNGGNSNLYIYIHNNPLSPVISEKLYSDYPEIDNYDTANQRFVGDVLMGIAEGRSTTITSEDIQAQEEFWQRRNKEELMKKGLNNVGQDAINNTGWGTGLGAISKSIGTIKPITGEVLDFITGQAGNLKKVAKKVWNWAKDFSNKSPEPQGNEEDEETTKQKASETPEDKFGPIGYDSPNTPPGEEKRYITGDETLHYRIDFWNKEDAEVPTQIAIIRDKLDPDLDWSTLNFTNIGFLDWNVDLPGGQTIDTRIDMRPQDDLAVDVNATFNPETGEIEWIFQAVDPITGDLNDVDPFAGFLPPFNPETQYELGWVEFTIDPKDNLPTGTEITNQAFVQFDLVNAFNPAPKEGPWLNTIDRTPPTSNVTPLPHTTNSPEITVNWSGSDNGSGIATYDIYVATDGGNFEPWLEDTPDTTATYTGEIGKTYSFYSVATDNVGHVEAAPTEADATTTLTEIITPPPSIAVEMLVDANGDDIFSNAEIGSAGENATFRVAIANTGEAAVTLAGDPHSQAILGDLVGTTLAAGESAIATFTLPLSDLVQTTVGTDHNDTLNGLQELLNAQISVTGTNAVGDSMTAVDDATVTVDVRDTISGGLGDDIIFGHGADDVLRGDRNSRNSGGKIGGDDIIHGGAGNDRIGGKAGNDTLFGDEGDDQIWGDDGDDIIRGGLGNDTLTGDDFSGGSGRDTFVLAIAEGTDTIVDFKQGEDIIGLTGNLTHGQLDITRQGDRTEIKFGQETLAVLEGVTSTLTQDDFVKMT